MLKGKVSYSNNPPTRAIVRLRKLPAEIDAAALEGVKAMSSSMESYARPNAPWRDRTGDARKYLKGYYGAYNAGKGKVYYAALKHGVPYGIWLEIRFSGRYGIVWRTLEVFKGKAGTFMRDALNKVGGNG
jgi:hypothetical protein